MQSLYNVTVVNVCYAGVSSEKLKALQTQLQEKEQEQLEMCQELQKKDKLVKTLETEVKKLRINHQKELRKKTENTDHLRADLEAKSNQVAYLTTELHKLKKLQLENAPKQTAYLDYTHGLVPAPPKEPVTFNIRRGHIRSRKKQELEERERAMNPVRVSSGGAIRPDSPAMELAHSLVEKQENVPVVAENKHPILPPIYQHQRPSTTDYPGNQASARPPVIVQHVMPSHSHHKKRVNISPEVQVIAVDQVNTDPKWATHAHESHSTEYN